MRLAAVIAIVLVTAVVGLVLFRPSTAPMTPPPATKPTAPPVATPAPPAPAPAPPAPRPPPPIEPPPPPRPADPLTTLPVLPRPQLRTIAAPDDTGFTVLGEGIRFRREDAVVLDGVQILDQGPADGLEVIACLKDGKTHEAMIRLVTGNAPLVKAAFLAAFGLGDGQPTEEASGLPARGWPLRVLVRWQDDDGAWREIDASSLVRDRIVDRPYPALPYVYTGSRMQMIPEVGADGRPQARELFMLAHTKSVVVNFDEPDALLASPLPGASVDERFETYSALAPHANQAVQVVFRPTTLPLVLSADAEGRLRRDGAELDDDALGAALAAVYGADATPVLRAVQVRVPATAPRTLDAAVRNRVLAAAAAVGAWVVPVFTGE